MCECKVYRIEEDRVECYACLQQLMPFVSTLGQKSLGYIYGVVRYPTEPRLSR
jgi:hypothetical protein